MSEPPAELAPLPPELAKLLRGNDEIRRACQGALRAAFQAGWDAGWAKGYTAGRAVTAAYAHRSGCNLNHPAGEPCEVPSDVGLRPVLRTRQPLARPGRPVELPVTLRAGETVSFPLPSITIPVSDNPEDDR